MHERAYERDSHKHANTSIYERAYDYMMRIPLILKHALICLY
jgi:hypothetical protein